MATYTVKKGDSLSAIALDILGSAKRWPEIAALNRINAPYTIYPGQALAIPDTARPPPAMPIVVANTPAETPPAGQALTVSGFFERYRQPLLIGGGLLALYLITQFFNLEDNDNED